MSKTYLEVLKFFKNLLDEDVFNVTWEKEGLKILNKIYKFKKLSDKENLELKVLIIKGIPLDLRKNYWMRASGALKSMKENPGYYKKLVTLSRNELKKNKFIDIINKDLNRSEFKNDIIFIEKVRNILLAYSLRCTSIGYCQGFNFIVEKIMKIMDKEEESFWLFVKILEDILPINYYSEMAGIIIDANIINEYFTNYFPIMNENLIMTDVNITNFIHKWLITIFSNNFKSELTYKIWDFLFLDGDIVLFKTSLTLFSILNKKVEYNNISFETLYILFNNGTNELSENNISLLYGLSLKKFKFNKKVIENKRNLISKLVINNLEDNTLRRYNNKNEIIKSKGKNSEKNNEKNNEKLKNKIINIHNTIDMNIDSNNFPIWFQLDDDKPEKVIQYLVLNGASDSILHENYFFNICNKNKNKKKQLKIQLKKINISKSASMKFIFKNTTYRNKVNNNNIESNIEPNPDLNKTIDFTNFKQKKKIIKIYEKDKKCHKISFNKVIKKSNSSINVMGKCRENTKINMCNNINKITRKLTL